MAKLAKKMQTLRALVQPGTQYTIEQALEIISKSKRNFVQSVDIAVNLGIVPSKENVRGAVILRNGTGKKVRVAVFAQGNNVEAAKAAGADMVGMDDLAKYFQDGNSDVNVVIAAMDAMGLVGRLGPVLGPRGLMPNPKVGTVTNDVAQAVRNAKGGQVRYKNDKNAIVHASIGKDNFTVEQLRENLEDLLNDIKKMKPNTSKGIYLRKLTLSTTMGPGVIVDLSSLGL